MMHKNNYFREWRERSGLKLIQVSNKVYELIESGEIEGKPLSYQYLSELERCVKDYNQRHLEVLSAVFGCEPWHLLIAPPDNNTDERSGFYLKEWRKHRGFTQESLAEACDFSKSFISNLEIGGRRYNQDTLEALAAALDIEPWQLVAGPPHLDGTEPLYGRRSHEVEELIEIWDRIGDEAKPQVKKVLRAFLPED